MQTGRTFTARLKKIIINFELLNLFFYISLSLESNWLERLIRGTLRQENTSGNLILLLLAIELFRDLRRSSSSTPVLGMAHSDTGWGCSGPCHWVSRRKIASDTKIKFIQLSLENEPNSSKFIPVLLSVTLELVLPQNGKKEKKKKTTLSSRSKLWV